MSFYKVLLVVMKINLISLNQCYQAGDNVKGIWGGGGVAVHWKVDSFYLLGFQETDISDVNIINGTT